MGQTAEELRGQLVSQRAEIGRDLDAIGDRVSPHRMVERKQAALRQRVGNVRDRVMGSVETSVDAVRDAGASAATSVGDSASTVVHGTRSAAEGNPLAVGLVAFGAGLVAAALFPATRAERDIAERAQPMLEKAASEAVPAARHVVEELEPAAQEAVADLRESAMDAASSVKEQAVGAAAETRQAVKGSVES
jgi:hypothetical protein